LITYLPARGPVILLQLIILRRELVCLRVGVPGSIGRDDSILTVLIGQVIGGELYQSNARLKLRVLTRWPVDTNIKLNAAVLDTVVNFDVGVVVLLQNRNLALGTMVKCLMNKIQNSYLVLFDLLMARSAPFAEGQTCGVCIQICLAPAGAVTSCKEKGRWRGEGAFHTWVASSSALK
jgi:hypothetical protein